MNLRVCTLAFALLAACGGKEPVNTPDGPDAVITKGAWYFSADMNANTWLVDIVSASGDTHGFALEDLSVLSGPTDLGGNGAGPSWGDPVASSSGDRVFVNATSIDRVAVLSTQNLALEAVLDVGGRPVHLWNPNEIGEIWTHADGPGAFYVIDENTLSVSDPVVVALNDTGHGKLVYAEALGTNYYATNTNDPGVFAIDGANRDVTGFIELCGVPCSDDPEATCGGTHDKGYNPTTNQLFFECSGDARGHFAFVDADTHTVVADLVPMSGGVASSPAGEYILVIHTNSGEIGVWDTRDPAHDGLTFDGTVTVTGHPSARGTQFTQAEDGAWEAWIPQTGGTSVAVVNLSTLDVELVDIGTITAPEEGHFERRSALGGGYFWTVNDKGVVRVDVQTREVLEGPALDALVARILWVDPA